MSNRDVRARCTASFDRCPDNLKLTLGMFLATTALISWENAACHPQNLKVRVMLVKYVVWWHSMVYQSGIEC